MAQSAPGSAQCPLVADTVTCTGDVSAGFRSDRNAAMLRLLFQNLTAPIAPTNGRPGIDVRPVGDLVLSLDASVTINSSNPSSFFPFVYNGVSNSPDAAVVLLFDPARQTTGTITNAGIVNSTITVDYQDQNSGSFFIADADVVNFTNTGTITATYTDTAESLGGSINLRQMSGVRIIGGDQIVFRNDGTIRNTGVQTYATFLEGRSIQLINSGEIISTYNNPARRDGGTTFGPKPTAAIAIGTPSAPASLIWRNSGTIRSLDTTRDSEFASPNAGDNHLALYGRGTIEIVNSGTLSVAGIDVSAGAQTRTDDLTATFTNSGNVDRVQLLLGTGALDARIFQGRTSIWRENAPAPTVVAYRNVDIRALNTGRLTTSRMGVYGEGDNVYVELINRGLFDGIAPQPGDFANFSNDPVLTLAASGQAPLSGNAVVRLVNEGNMVLTESIFTGIGHDLIEVSSSHRADLTNSGNLSLETGSARTYGILLGQGQTDVSTIVGSTVRVTPSYVFDGAATLRNSGKLSFTGRLGIRDWTYGLVGQTVSNLDVINSGAVSIISTRTQDPYVAIGAILRSFSNITLDNNAPITIDSTTDAGINDGIGIMFIELSLKANEAAAAQAEGRVRGYDRAVDLGSVVTLNLNAGDITVSAAGGIGIYGRLGVTRERASDNGYDSVTGDAVENGASRARINIAGGVSVIGGSGTGAAINLEGAGGIVLNNAGVIVSRSDQSGGAVLLGRPITLANYRTLPSATAGLTLNLVDSVNTGTITGGAGRGIWIQTGAITNLVNRGTISGAVAAIEARDAGSIDNQTGGVIDGAIVLSGAGSTLRNGGAIRVTSGAAATSTINGSYTQLVGGALSLRFTDRFNVAGNFALAGDLNLALGAPSSNAIITVGGNLTLDGRLNVSDSGRFGDGVYRIFDYGGTLTDNVLDVGVLPSGARGTVQTSIARQVNLIVSSNIIQFWDGTQTTADGAIAGGSGSWGGATTNWTNSGGSVNEGWASGFAVFQGASGTVTIAPGGVSASGLQFAVSDYRIEGGNLTLTAPATLRVGDGSAAGAGYTARIASIIGGSGGIEKTDLGTLVLTGANTYSGGTRISSGVLDIASDAALGATSGNVTLDSGALRLSGAVSSARGFAFGAAGGTIDTQANAVTLSGLLSGSGRLTKMGSGTLTLSGANGSFAGPTMLSAGTLAITGTLGGNVVVEAGTLSVVGTLTGDATINGGTLNLAGTVAGSTSIAVGARLIGAGNLAGLTLAGTLAPGNSVGTLNASGNVRFRAGSFYDVELAAGGGTDLLRTTGTATIEGGTVRIATLDPETQYRDGTRYTILSAMGGLTGRFAGLTENSAFLDFALSYGANDAVLTVSVIRTFPDVAKTFNQRQASAGLKDLGKAPGSDSLAVYNTVLFLDEVPARAAFDLSSGEIYASLLTAEQRRGSGLANQLVGEARASGAEGWFAWATGAGQSGSIDGDGNGARFETESVGGTFGIGYRGENSLWSFGAAGGFIDGDVSLAARSSAADFEGWHLGAYASSGTGGEGFTLSASAVYASVDADVTRQIGFAALSRTSRAMTKAETFAFAAEARYGVGLEGGISVGPIASLSYADTTLGRFAETGADALNLSARENSDSRLRYTTGIFARADFSNGSLDATVQYLGGERDDSEVTLNLAGASTTPFRVRAASGDRSAALLTLSADVDLDNRWSIAADLRAVAGNDERDIAASVTARFEF